MATLRALTLSAPVSLALLSSPIEAQQAPYQIGPRTLYPAPKDEAHADVPLVMRDAIQNIALGSRLIPVAPRIIGGEPAPANIYPWIASIGLKGLDPRDGHFCGGAFIAANWVLTAAHCVTRETADKIQVVGAINELGRAATVNLVDQVIIHEKYDADSSDYDVALLRLTKRASARTIRLLTAPDAARLEQPGNLAIVAGWGLTAEGGQVSNLLRHVTVQFVSNKVCNGLASYSGSITDRMICAGFAEGGKDSCQGDSGGPLVVADGQGSYLQAGVVSFGDGCARPNKFGVYTNVAVVQPWIAGKIGGGPNAAEPPSPPRIRSGMPGTNSRASVRSIRPPAYKRVVPRNRGTSKRKGSHAASVMPAVFGTDAFAAADRMSSIDK
jgi:transmembrane serine protease 9